MAARVLLVLALGALYAQYSALTTPGLHDAVSALVDAKTFPDSDTDESLLRTLHTGIEPLDRFLASIVVLRWPLSLSDRSDAALSPITISHAGWASAIWTLLLLEGYRGGNKGRIVAFPTLFALLGQFLPFAFVTCIYGAIHLWLGTSSAAYSLTKQDVKVPRAVLTVLPIVTLLGFAAPVVLSLVPASSQFTLLALGPMTAWPLLASVAVSIVHAVSSWGKSGNSAPGFVNPAVGGTALRDLRYARLLRVVYEVSFLVPAVTYAVGLVLPLMAFVAPGFISSSLAFLQHQSLGPAHVTGAFGAIQWYLAIDCILSSPGVLLWAGFVHRQMNVTESTSYWKLGSLVVFAGPVAAAVWMVWERDCVALGLNGRSGLSVSFDSDNKGKTRPRGGSGMGIGKWERGGKVLVLP
ncbi:hypothetical protein BDW69DRAFT_181412 [Aspergillus filifer]